MRPELPVHQPRDPAYAARVRASFDLQQAMTLIGAELAIVEPGYTEIQSPAIPRSTCLTGPRSPSSTASSMAASSA